MSAASTALRLGLALACLGLALRSQRAAPAPVVIVQPLAPPLTRISALGDRTIGAAGPPPQGPPLQGPPLQGPPSSAFAPPGDPRAHALRVLVEADALALATRLGPERLAWALAHREELSAAYAETAAWRDLVDSLRSTP